MGAEIIQSQGSDVRALRLTVGVYVLVLAIKLAVYSVLCLVILIGTASAHVGLAPAGSVKYAWTFQYSDYLGSTATPPTTPALPSGTQPAGMEWYNSPAGAAILLVSLVMLAGIIYLFIRGLKER